MTKTFIFNKEFLEYDVNKPLLPVDERATNFGDGVYEVIKIYNGKYYLLEEHLDRLYRSLDLIKVDFYYNREELTNKLNELLDKNDFIESGHVYFQISRGSAVRNHIYPKNTEPNFYAYLVDEPRPLNTILNGVSATVVDDIRWLHCDIKSLNLLPNVMAKNEARENGFYEAIQVRDGFVTEGSSSNIYAIHKGVIYTHHDCNLILPGVVKRRVLKLVEENNITLIEKHFTPSFLLAADEVFLTSSTSEITPIINIDGNAIGDGKVGELTKKLQELYAADAKIN